MQTSDDIEIMGEGQYAWVESHAAAKRPHLSQSVYEFSSVAMLQQ